MKPFRFFAAAFLAVGLVGCAPTEADRAQAIQEMNDKLPRDCKFFDLGSYRGDRIYAVRCAKSVTSTNWSWRPGPKSGTRYAASYWESEE